MGKPVISVTALAFCQYLPPPSPSQSERGKAIHEYLQKFIPEAKVEVPVQKDFNDFILVGKVDAINAKGEPIEIKSGKEKPEHLTQLRIYMNMLSVNTGYLVYYKREVVQVIGALSDEEIISLYQKYKEGRNYGHCDYCEYAKNCIVRFHLNA